MCCGKPTITITTIQECHDNDKIELHNHNEYPLLYKEAEIPAPSLVILECQKCSILVITQALRRSIVRIYQAKHSVNRLFLSHEQLTSNSVLWYTSAYKLV